MQYGLACIYKKEREINTKRVRMGCSVSTICARSPRAKPVTLLVDASFLDLTAVFHWKLFRQRSWHTDVLMFSADPVGRAGSTLVGVILRVRSGVFQDVPVLQDETYLGRKYAFAVVCVNLRKETVTSRATVCLECTTITEVVSFAHDVLSSRVHVVLPPMTSTRFASLTCYLRS